MLVGYIGIILYVFVLICVTTVFHYMTATRIINLKNRKAVIDFLDNNLDIDENMIYRIKQQFKHRWKQILISLDITRINVESIKVIIQNQNVQFMQIKRTICSLNT